MNIHDQKDIPVEGSNLHGNPNSSRLPDQEGLEDFVAEQSGASLTRDIEQTIQLGEQFAGVLSGIAGLARVEATLAIRTFPKVLMLWLLFMPIMLLTWCAFCALISWSIYAASEEIGLGMLAFFLLQVLLLLSCHWLYAKYRIYMSLPYTRAQIDDFVRSTKDAFNSRAKTKE